MFVCVFCGSSDGVRADYRESARALGRLLGERGVGLVYGGASVGMMGELASSALQAGAQVVGVIPRHLVDHELAHRGLTRLVIVDTMHERKARMAELADGFVALPGGAGTLEELFEVWTWGQLGLHRKPCGLLNVGGYYDTLRLHVDRMVAEGFLRPEYRRMLVIEEHAGSLLDRFASYVPPVDKWSARNGDVAARSVSRRTRVESLAWVHVEAGRLLVVRTRGKDRFYLPGGKRQPLESDAQALAREVREELGVRLRPETLSLVEVFVEQAHGYPEGTLLRMACYTADHEGDIAAQGEIEELSWFDLGDRDRCAPAAQLVMEELARRGLIG